MDEQFFKENYEQFFKENHEVCLSSLIIAKDKTTYIVVDTNILNNDNV